MGIQDKLWTVAVALFGGAVLILAVVPISLYALKAMNNGAGLDLPYSLWVVLYFCYALMIVFSVSDDSLSRKGFGRR